MAVLALYINILAAASDVLSWMGYLPIVRDCFGHVMNLGRLVRPDKSLAFIDYSSGLTLLRNSSARPMNA